MTNGEDSDDDGYYNTDKLSSHNVSKNGNVSVAVICNENNTSTSSVEGTMGISVDEDVQHQSSTSRCTTITYSPFIVTLEMIERAKHVTYL